MFVTKAKVKGKFVTLGTFSNLGQAFNRGKQFVENTASATFKVESGGTTVKPQGFLGRGFAPSKSNKGAIIQQRSFRIQTQGEKIEISSKGRLFKKRKGVFVVRL